MYVSKYVCMYVCITMMGYIEYRIDNFGLKKHLPESVKKPIHRIKSSPGIEKNLYIEYFRLSILIQENNFAQFLPDAWIAAAAYFGTPHDRCRRTMEKRLFCNENQWN